MAIKNSAQQSAIIRPTEFPTSVLSSTDVFPQSSHLAHSNRHPWVSCMAKSWAESLEPPGLFAWPLADSGAWLLPKSKTAFKMPSDALPTCCRMDAVQKKQSHIEHCIPEKRPSCMELVMSNNCRWTKMLSPFNFLEGIRMCTMALVDSVGCWHVEISGASMSPDSRDQVLKIMITHS